jgi:hypothetical protein
MLGLILDTNKPTIAITHKYLNEVLDLLNSTWHPKRHCFKVSKAQKLTGKFTCVLQKGQIGHSICSPIYIYLLLMHYPRTKNSWWNHLVSFVQLPKLCKLALS